MNKFSKVLLASAIFAGFFTSCNNNDPSDDRQFMVFNLTMPEDSYNAEGYWTQVYDPQTTFFGQYPYIYFSHLAQVTQYDGVEYKSFTGFCPSIVEDATDHSGDDWTLYQFAAYPPSYGQGYVIAHWDTRENSSTPVEQRSCIINFATPVTPVAMTVANTSYAYWVMKNGSAFSRPFDSSSWLALDIYGVRADNSEFLAQTVNLAQNGNINGQWQQIDLSTIGEVKMLYFTMRSSDSGEWGMNTPAYFAIGGISAWYPSF